MKETNVDGSRTGWDVFIAYASEDAAAARELYELLRVECRVFLDRTRLEPGKPWDAALADHLRVSRIVVVVVSRHFRDAWFARDEAYAAIELVRSDPESHRVVPVYLDDGADGPVEVPYGLGLVGGMFVSRDGGIEGIAGRILALAHGREATEEPPAPATATSGGHVLDPYPRGPRVEAHRIPRSIIDAFAESVPRAEASTVLNEAIACRLEADPGDPTATAIRPHFLPDPQVVPAFEYWQAVFTEARLNGPRMLAAVLLALREDRFPLPALEARRDLLRFLKDGERSLMRGEA